MVQGGMNVGMNKLISVKYRTAQLSVNKAISVSERRPVIAWRSKRAREKAEYGPSGTAIYSVLGQRRL